MKYTTYTAGTLEYLSEMLNEEIGRLTGIETVMIESGSPALMVEESRLLEKIRDARQSLALASERIRAEQDAEFEWVSHLPKAPVAITSISV